MREPWSDDAPIYLQIARRIGQDIKAGRRTERHLPSQRDLAREFGVGRNTIIKAMDILKRDGLIETLPRVRSKVSAPALDFANKLEGFMSRSGFEHTPYHEASQVRDSSLQDVIFMSRYNDERWDGYLNADLVVDALRDRVAKMKAGHYANIYDSAGQPELRERLSEYVSSYAGIRVRPSQILILSQWMQTFRLIAEVLLGPGVELWLPQHSLAHLYGVGKRQAAHRRYLPADSQGTVITPMLKSKLHKVIVLDPDGQKPDGMTVSIPRRRELVSFARTTGSFIVEDGYTRELVDDPMPSLLSFDPELQSVIHLSAIPVPITPFSGLVWVVAHEKLIEQFRACVRHELLSTSHGPQLVMTELLASGRYADMVAQSRAYHRAQQARAEAILEREMTGLGTWVCPAGFGSIWFDVRPDVSVKNLYATRVGVDFQPGYLYGEKGGNHIALRYNMPIDRFEEGIKRLAGLIRHALARQERGGRPSKVSS